MYIILIKYNIYYKVISLSHYNIKLNEIVTVFNYNNFKVDLIRT